MAFEIRPAPEYPSWNSRPDTGRGRIVALPAVVGYNWVQKKVGEVESNITGLTRLLGAILRYREQHTPASPPSTSLIVPAVHHPHSSLNGHTSHEAFDLGAET